MDLLNLRKSTWVSRSILAVVVIIMVAIGAMIFSASRQKESAARDVARHLASYQQRLTGKPYRSDNCRNGSPHCLVFPGPFINDQGKELRDSPAQLEISSTHQEFEKLIIRAWYGDEIVTWVYNNESLDDDSLDFTQFLRFSTSQMPGPFINGDLHPAKPAKAISQTFRRRASHQPGRVFFISTGIYKVIINRESLANSAQI